jgi:hypothetical protein
MSTNSSAIDGAAQVWSSAGAAAASSAGRALAALMGVGTELQARLRTESEAHLALQAQVCGPCLWTGVAWETCQLLHAMPCHAVLPCEARISAGMVSMTFVQSSHVLPLFTCSCYDILHTCDEPHAAHPTCASDSAAMLLHADAG